MRDIDELKSRSHEHTVLLSHKNIKKDSPNMRNEVRALLRDLGLSETVIELVSIRKFGDSDRFMIELPSHDSKIRLLMTRKNYLRAQPNSNLRINEFLSRRNAEILKAALNLKRSKKLHSAYSFNGRVYVRRSDGDNSVLVIDLAQLDTFANEV